MRTSMELLHPVLLVDIVYANIELSGLTELFQRAPVCPCSTKEPLAAPPASGIKIYLEASVLLINFVPFTPLIAVYSCLVLFINSAHSSSVGILQLSPIFTAAASTSGFNIPSSRFAVSHAVSESGSSPPPDKYLQ